MISVDYSDFVALDERLKRFGAGCGRVIDERLHGEGAQKIKQYIPGFIHPSGRRWKGKAPSMAGNPGAGEKLAQDNEPMKVTIVARGRYGYLYFPDDGTNTRKHVGNQQFMLRGAERAAPEITEGLVSDLVEAFEN
ncbi:MAG: hypothetical protein IKL97_01935 [Eggerthellaceae bacterium]|nr:hypothetical protein [Eggerthellaceae bacterium]